MKNQKNTKTKLLGQLNTWVDNLSARKNGLALGGGAVLGAAHIGVLKAIEEYKIPIDYIAGTSIGSVVAAFYAFGHSPDEIEEIVLGLDWLDISNLAFSKYGILSNKGLGDLIKAELGDVSFNESKIPLAVVATDIYRGEKVVLKEGRVIPALMASTCIPGIFEPVRYHDELLVDGGIVENVPTSVVREMGANFIIGVDLTTTHLKTEPEDILGVLLKTFDIAFKYQTKLQMSDADILLKLDLSEFSLIDTSQTPRLIIKGYQEASNKFQKEARMP